MPFFPLVHSKPHSPRELFFLTTILHLVHSWGTFTCTIINFSAEHLSYTYIFTHTYFMNNYIYTPASPSQTKGLESRLHLFSVSIKFIPNINNNYNACNK
jgi:hypothetical protein